MVGKGVLRGEKIGKGARLTTENGADPLKGEKTPCLHHLSSLRERLPK